MLKKPRSCQFPTDRRLSVLGIFITVYALNFPKMGERACSSEFCIFGQKITDKQYMQQFSHSPKFREGSCLSSCQDLNDYQNCWLIFTVLSPIYSGSAVNLQSTDRLLKIPPLQNASLHYLVNFVSFGMCG